MFIDSHCHLDYLDLAEHDNDLSVLVQAAQVAGVSGMLSISVDRDNVGEVSRIAASFPNVWGSVGVHPMHVEEPPGVDELLAWARPKDIVAFGETGLDYHYDTVERDLQQVSFRNHLRAAASAGLPVVVHSRSARADTLQILEEERAASAGGVLHCFTEDWTMADRALALNYYISISGIVTFRNADQLRDVATRIPLDRLLIETDSPYLAPVPHRGQPNEPRFLPEVARCIATLRGLSIEELAEATTENFYRLFTRAQPGG